MPITSPGNDDDTGENHQPTLRKNTAEPVEQTLKQNTLQLRDIDLENLQLHVRHSVNRGPDDRGKYQLCEPKTKSSKRVVPIPKPLAPLIEAHISVCVQLVVAGLVTMIFRV